MQEVNLKTYILQFILPTFLFRVLCLHKKFQSQSFWSYAWRGSDRNNILLHAYHTSAALH
jgi:hypothetical protein